MKRRFTRFAASVAVAASSLLAVGVHSASAQTTLGIGDKAPALNIEHFIHNKKSDFAKTQKFEEGKVYVVEFWATWCGPCIQSMPHLVELQNQYRDQGVQIVSISDEDLETVKELLEQEYPGKDETFSELTSAYTLTVDPDGSSTDDYMRAAGQNGIPASFLVGKTGVIEWIGHPMEIDEPIAEVLADSWDREAYKLQMKRMEQFQVVMQKVSTLAGKGDFDDALKAIDKFNDEIKGDKGDQADSMRKQLVTFKYNLRLDSGDQSDEVIAFFREQLKEAKNDSRELIQFAYTMMSTMEQGTDPGPLATETMTALEETVGDAEDDFKTIMYVVLARMNASMSNLDAAIENQKKAVESTTGRQQERMQQMLESFEEMKNTKENPDAEKSDDE